MATVHMRQPGADAALKAGAAAPGEESKPPRKPSFAEAMSMVRSAVRPARIEHVELEKALGRLTASPVVAARNNPGFDVSAMDGFALAWSTTLDATPDAPICLRCVAPILPGMNPAPAVAGTCAPISTGAMIPPGYDAVVTREKATILDGAAGKCLLLDAPVRPLLNVRQAGEDARAGQSVMPAGRTVTAVAIGAFASFGVRRIDVFQKPGIALLQTGDELAPADTVPRDGDIPDANGPMIDAMVREAGLFVHARSQCRDDPEQLITRISLLIEDADCDIIVSTGAISAGDQDWVPRVLERLGAKIIFCGVRMRPGKPVLLAVLPNGTLFFGLPGNPVAAALGFRFFVCGAIRAMWGLPPEQAQILNVRAASTPGATQFLKARRIDVDGPAVEILNGQQSHRMRSLIDADCWLAIDPDTQIASVYPLEVPW